MYADVQILLTYFEKLATIEQGMADKSLFREINQQALNYYNMFPHLTSNHLLQAALVIQHAKGTTWSSHKGTIPLAVNGTT